MQYFVGVTVDSQLNGRRIMMTQCCPSAKGVLFTFVTMKESQKGVYY